MKELSIEEKAKRYDKAIEKAEKWHNAPNVDKIPTFGNRIIEDIFPELKESEGETNIPKNNLLKVEPKFKIGDGVVFNNNHQSIYQVEKIEDGYYILRHTYGGTFRVCVLHDESLRLWTIKDAKEGDVLAASDDSVFIFVRVDNHSCIFHIALANDGRLVINPRLISAWENVRGVKPATKEQHDKLEKAMANAGYKWNKEERKLEKI